MRYDEKLYLKVKSEAEKWLFQIPRVYGVALGLKAVAGQITSEIAIQVYVKSKLPIDELPAAEIIPSEIEGIKTDVIQGGPITTAAVTDPTPYRNCPTEAITAVSQTNPVVITTPSHELSTGDEVRIFGVNGVDDLRSFPIEKTENDDTTFKLPDVDTSSAMAYKGGGVWFKMCSPKSPCCCPGGAITGAEKGDPVLITTSKPHGLQDDERVRIGQMKAMRQIQDNEFTVGKTDSETIFKLRVDGSNYSEDAIESGSWAKACINQSGLITGATRTNPVRITSTNHGLSRGDRVHIFGVFGMTNINSVNREEPYEIDNVQQNTFELKGIDGTGFVAYTSRGCWLKIHQDELTYSRIRGGIRIAMGKESTMAPSREPSSGIGMVHRPSEKITVQTVFNFGTLGCLAIDNETCDRVILSNYHILYCIPGEQDVQHPDYSKCKSHRIATVLRHADHGTETNLAMVDAAIAKLKDDAMADPVIVDIGPVKGRADVTMDDIQITEDMRKGYRVRKRGITTLLTEGFVFALDGNFLDPSTNVYLNNQMVIHPMAGTGRGAFAAKGDSGSAVVNDHNEVVGLLVGADAAGFGFASPIGAVERLLKITIMTDDPKQMEKCKNKGQKVADDGEPLRVSVAYPKLLMNVVSEVLGSEACAQYLALAQRHYREVEDLIHYNKRVAAVWRHNEGPKLLQELQRFVEVRDKPLPKSLNGRSLIESLEKIIAAFKKFGSSELVSDLTRYAPDVLELLGLSYSDVLTTLRAKSNA
jgi:hypothetical protein